MKTFRSFVFCLVVVALIGLVLSSRNSLATRQTPGAPGANAREDAYRSNNIGVALLEQFKYKEGADAFRNALKIDPKLNLAHINLGIALYNVPDLAGSLSPPGSL